MPRNRKSARRSPKSSKRKKPNHEERPHAHHKTTEIQGFLILTFSILLFLSLISFAYGQQAQNWLGAIGYSVGWVLHTSLGITSYLLSVFLAWIGWRKLFDKSINHFKIKVMYFILLCLSFSVLLSLIERESPNFALSLKELFYPSSTRYPIPYHLGGLPALFLR